MTYSVFHVFGHQRGFLKVDMEPQDKIGHKLLLGQKYSLVSFETCKEAVCKKEECHDLVF